MLKSYDDIVAWIFDIFGKNLEIKNDFQTIRRGIVSGNLMNISPSNTSPDICLTERIYQKYIWLLLAAVSINRLNTSFHFYHLHSYDLESDFL